MFAAVYAFAAVSVLLVKPGAGCSDTSSYWCSYAFQGSWLCSRAAISEYLCKRSCGNCRRRVQSSTTEDISVAVPALDGGVAQGQPQEERRRIDVEPDCSLCENVAGCSMVFVNHDDVEDEFRWCATTGVLSSKNMCTGYGLREVYGKNDVDRYWKWCPAVVPECVERPWCKNVPSGITCKSYLLKFCPNTCGTCTGRRTEVEEETPAMKKSPVMKELQEMVALAGN